jgi:hypothetical protein
MINLNCNKIFFCPFKAEASLLSAHVKDCRKINSQTWSSKQTMIFTWNGAGFLPMQKFLDCFPVDKLKEKDIFLFGSAGSVDDEHQPGDIFALSRVKYKKKFFDLPAIGELPEILSLTSDTPVMSNILRQNIFERHGSCLVDQESFHFVEYFKNHSIEPGIIRFVSDTPSFSFRLPFARALTSRFAENWEKLNFID